MDRCSEGAQQFSHGATSARFSNFCHFWFLCPTHSLLMRVQRIVKSPPQLLEGKKSPANITQRSKVHLWQPTRNNWRTLFWNIFFFRCSIDLAFFWREAGAWAIFRHFLLEETSSEWVQWCGHWKSYLDHQSKERSRRFSLQVALEHTEQVSFLQVARVMLPAWWPLLPLLVLTCYLWPLGY